MLHIKNTFLFIPLLFSTSYLYATTSEYTSSLAKSQLAKNVTLTVSDPTYPGDQNINKYLIKSRKVKVSLVYTRENQTDNASSKAWDYTISYELYTGNNNNLSENNTLKISFNNPGGIYQQINPYDTKLGWAQIKITGVSSSNMNLVPADIRLDLSIEAAHYTRQSNWAISILN